MTIVVAYLDTPEGSAALEEAVRIAATSDERVVAVLSRARSDEDDHGVVERDADTARERLDRADVAHVLRHVGPGQDPGSEIVAAAVETGARLVVIGLARRTPTGKLLLGLGAQLVLLQSPCPVLVVHPAPELHTA